MRKYYRNHTSSRRGGTVWIQSDRSVTVQLFAVGFQQGVRLLFCCFRFYQHVSCEFDRLVDFCGSLIDNAKRECLIALRTDRSNPSEDPTPPIPRHGFSPFSETVLRPRTASLRLCTFTNINILQLNLGRRLVQQRQACT